LPAPHLDDVCVPHAEDVGLRDSEAGGGHRAGPPRLSTPPIGATTPVDGVAGRGQAISTTFTSGSEVESRHDGLEVGIVDPA